jgi:hypothetical protein
VLAMHHARIDAQMPVMAQPAERISAVPTMKITR